MDFSSSGGFSLFEAESFIRSLREFSLDEIGSPAWFLQHEHIESLNVHAHYQALYQSHDEFIMEIFLQNPSACRVLLQSLFLIDYYKENIWPKLLPRLKPEHSVKCYLICYHEAIIINLLEIFFYHAAFLESLEDSLNEFILYGHKKIVALQIGKFKEILEEKDETLKGNSQKNGKSSGVEESEELQKTMKNHQLNIDYSIAMGCLSMIRFVTDHIKSCPFSVIPLLMNQLDLPLLLAALLDVAPWQRRVRISAIMDNSGPTQKIVKPAMEYLEKFEDQAWKKIPEGEEKFLSKLEGQVFIALYNLLLAQECRPFYEFHSIRIESLLKLKKYLYPSSLLFDQLPILKDLYRFIEELAIVPIQGNEKSLPAIEAVPAIMNSILKDAQQWKLANGIEASGKGCEWSIYLDRAFDVENGIFRQNRQEEIEQSKRFSSLYQMEELESLLLNEIPHCSVCGEKEAVFRCSRCHSDWYCGKDCQLKQWPLHKGICKERVKQKKEREKLIDKMRQEKLEKEQSQRDEEERKERERMKLLKEKRNLQGPLKGSQKIEILED